MTFHSLSGLKTGLCLTAMLLFSGLSSAAAFLGDNQPGGIEYDFTFEFDNLNQSLSIGTDQLLDTADGSGSGVVGSVKSNSWGSTSADQITWTKVNLNALQNGNHMGPNGAKPRYFKMYAEMGSSDGLLVPAITAWLGSHDLPGQSDGSGEYFPNKFQEKVPFWFANGLTFMGELEWDVGENGNAKISGLIPAINNGLYDMVTLAIGGSDWGNFDRSFDLNIRFSPVWNTPVPIPAALYLFASGLLVSARVAKKGNCKITNSSD